MLGSPPDDSVRNRRSTGPQFDGGQFRPAPGPAGRGPVPGPAPAPAARDPRGGGDTATRTRREEPTRGRRALRGAEAPEPDDDLDITDEGPELPIVPVRRMLALAVAGFALLLATGLVMGAQTAGVGLGRVPYAAVVFGAQLLYMFATTMAMRPPALKVVATVGVLAAIAADIGAIYPDTPSVTPLGLVAGGGLVAGVLGQMFRPQGRMRVSESLASTVVIVLGVVSFATLIVLTRVPAGTQAIVVCLIASGIALGVARLTDVVAPWPRLADQVPRGSAGIVLGAMLGTAAAALIGRYMVPFTPHEAALVGMAAAGAAVLADLTIGFAEAGRELAGDAPTMWLARHMQGPLAGFALAAPVAYVISVVFLVPA
ncbi:hypothetical protein Cs7R123_36670 [Catellatospora sp. TT07R-123]|nr:hypothetical protein [Catellatospora sp. TT07R-123]GHJ46325.1 hypothetical protein Cs7R123_36670 [Catellatospora sp. TT07R-123]